MGDVIVDSFHGVPARRKWPRVEVDVHVCDKKIDTVPPVAHKDSKFNVTRVNE